MNDVERFYEAARKHFPDSIPWKQLHPMQQMMVVQGVNMIMEVMRSE